MKRILIGLCFLIACGLFISNSAWPIPPFPPKTGAGTGDMTKATYDTNSNNKIDANKIDDLSATYMPVGWISRAGTNNILTYTGNYSLGITLSGATAVTFPTSGTLATTTLKPTDLSITSQAAGDVLYFDGTNWVRLAKDAGKYLKSGDSAVSWDTPAGSGSATSTITGSGLTADKVYYMASGGLTLAKADASTTVPGICVASDATTCQFSGEYQMSASPSWTVGGLVYVSAASAGALTQTIPSTSGNQVSVIGVATAVDTVLIMPSLVVVQVP